MNPYTRGVIVGEVNSGKTYAALSFEGPTVVQFYPGEGGSATLPEDTDALKRVFPTRSLTTLIQNSGQIIEGVRKQTVEILQGKHGACTTFWGDGIDKLYEHVLDALSGGSYFSGEAVKDKAGEEESLSALTIARAQHWLWGYLALIIESPVPYAFFTMWDKDKADRKAQMLPSGKKEHWATLPTRKYPNLYGSAARDLVGKFPIVLHASHGKLDAAGTRPPDQNKAVYRWQTKADSRVFAAGIKGKPELIEQIPKFIPAQWPVLAGYLGYTLTEVSTRGETT